MSFPDIGGVVGVALMLFAYAGGQVARLDMTALPALLMNLVGSLLVLWSLAYRFNLSATLMESAWALVALYGLVKLALRKRS
ncbi:MAG: conserved hypothetical rane spanning protein [Caulobacteraceae bacterium]|nr:conserved hypothetical rane spanning protein [Caulobacteraceae bacterium]